MAPSVFRNGLSIVYNSCGLDRTGPFPPLQFIFIFFTTEHLLHHQLSASNNSTTPLVTVDIIGFAYNEDEKEYCSGLQRKIRDRKMDHIFKFHNHSLQNNEKVSVTISLSIGRHSNFKLDV